MMPKIEHFPESQWLKPLNLLGLFMQQSLFKLKVPLSPKPLPLLVTGGEWEME